MFIQTTRYTSCELTFLLVFTALLTMAALPAGAQQIDSENDNGMVIDDMWYPFADYVEFYADPDKTTLANRGDFRQGSRIGFELDAEGKLSAVWLR